MNAKELAEKSGMHENTIRNMIKRGELRAVKSGKSYEIEEGQAQKLIVSNMVKTKVGENIGSLDSQILSKKTEMSNLLLNIKSEIEKDTEPLSFNSELFVKYISLEEEVINLEKTRRYILTRVDELIEGALSEIRK